jgi:hypothetical protein
MRTRVVRDVQLDPGREQRGPRGEGARGGAAGVREREHAHAAVGSRLRAHHGVGVDHRAARCSALGKVSLVSASRRRGSCRVRCVDRLRWLRLRK